MILLKLALNVKRLSNYRKRDKLTCRDNHCYHLALAIVKEGKSEVQRRYNSSQDSIAFKSFIFPRHILSMKYIVNLVIVILIELTKIFHTMIKHLVHKLDLDDAITS